MKIENNPNVSKAMSIYNKNKNEKVQKSKALNQQNDKLDISKKAKDYKVAMEAFNNLPDTREEKVGEIKQKLQNNSYNVSGEEIADKIIESVMIDKKI